MGLYTGFYQGATVVRLCSAGRNVINATLQSGSVIQGELNAEVTARMHRLAVVDRLSRVKERVGALVMPMSPLDISGMLAGMVAEEEEVGKVDAIEKELEGEGIFGGEVGITGVDLDAVEGAGGLMDTGEMLVNLNEEEENFGEGDGDDEGQDSSREEEEDEGGGEGENRASSSPAPYHLDVSPPSGSSAVNCLSSNSPGNSRSGKRGGDDKAEIRKKRNREAAARSNLKRKMRNERVRRDLASLTQRAIRLQIKERMCREENTRLRNALQRAGGRYHLTKSSS